MSAVDGLVSGLNTTQIIQQLMQVERQPQMSVARRRDALSAKLALYQTLNSNLSDVKSKARDINLGAFWKLAKATSSNTSIANATTTLGALPGTLSFIVDRLAQANIKSSSGYVASTATQAANANFLVGKGGAIGIGVMEGSEGLSLGSHTLEVTTASTGASVSGTALDDEINVGSSDTIEVNISGIPHTISLDPGTYTRRALADMITEASGGKIIATINGNKALTLTTAREGSEATLEISGGVNLSNLNIETTEEAVEGTDGVIKVNGVSNTVSDIDPFSTDRITLNGQNSDTISVTFSGGLRAGTVTAKNVSYGDGKLSSIVANINASGAGITATAIQVGDGQYKMQLTSGSQGRAGSISIDSRAFSGFLGSMDDLVAGADSKIIVGSGTNEYALNASSNTINTILPGVTINLLKASEEAVTLTIDKDYDKLADKVKSFVDAANSALSFIKRNSSYDPQTKQAGKLLGDSVVLQLQTSLTQAISNGVSGSSVGSTGTAGITLAADGTFSFDSDKFISKFKENPEELTRLFVEGGTSGSSPGINPGVVDRVLKTVNAMTDVKSGLLWNTIQSGNSQTRDYDRLISSWDDRLALKEKALRRQFTAMETALGQLRSLQNRMGGQFSRLS